MTFIVRLATLLVLLLVARSVLAQSVPVIDRPVVDVAEVTTASGRAALSRKLEAHRSASGVQMAVLIVPSANGVKIEDYAREVASRWGGPGGPKGERVLLVVSVNDRRARLDVGAGIGPLLSDRRAQKILDGAGEGLAAKQYDAAVTGIVDDVIAATAVGLRPADRPWGFRLFPWLYGIAMVASAIASFIARRRRAAAPPEEHALPGGAIFYWPVASVALIVALVAGRDFRLPHFAACASGALLGALCHHLAFSERVGWAFTCAGAYVVSFMLCIELASDDRSPFGLLRLAGVHLLWSPALAMVFVIMPSRRRRRWWGYGSSGWTSNDSSGSFSGSSSGGSFGGGGASSSW